MAELTPIIGSTRFQDLTGRRFGRLTVISCLGKTPGGMSVWLCKCDCGEIRKVQIGNLKNGHTSSCGCYNAEHQADLRRTHGLSETKEFKIWLGMIQRCCNKNHPAFDRYGGRGIKVSRCWRNSFAHFLADMGNCPSEEHSIERVDNDGNYESANCRWATRAEQSRNKKNNVWLTLNGRTQIVEDWAQELGFNPQALRDRMKKGWSDEAVLTTPKKRNQHG